MAGGELKNGGGLKKKKSKVAKVKKWFIYTTLDLRWKIKEEFRKFKSELHPPPEPFQCVVYVVPPAGAGPVPCNPRPEDMGYERLDSSP